MTLPEPLLALSGVEKSYAGPAGRIPILGGAGLRVAAREIVAVLGASGVGKTTLLNLIGMMDRPDAGSIRIDGLEVTGLPESERCALRARRIGFVFQFHHLLPEFSAAENVAMPLWIRGEPAGPSLARAGALLERLGLRERVSHLPAALSAGEQQRVAIARALVGEPLLFLADEPTGSLDPLAGEAVFDLLLEAHSAFGLTTLLVTHNRDLARRCNRVLRLEAGRLHEVDTPGGLG